MGQIPNKLHREIIPGILEQDFSQIEKKLERIKPFAPYVHIDLLDGIYAPNKTFMDPAPFEKYTKDMLFEIHMMVDNPIDYLKPWADVGCKRFIGQVEKMKDIPEFVAQGQLLGEVGLALDTPTPIEALTFDIEDLDFVFIMTVKAGFSNQSFLPEMLEKVKKIRSRDPLIPIEVDGGISDATIMLAKEAGATRFVSTGYIFNQGENPSLQYQHLCSLVTV